MTYEAFIVQFPEFAETDVALVRAHLDAASLEISPKTWGALADQGQAYLAAHKLALSPAGQNARLVADDGTTTYGRHYQSLLRTVALGVAVA
jgi:hypothetical protein